MKENKEDKPLKKLIEKKEEEISNLKDKILTLENNWKRALADYKNMEKRNLEEKTRYYALAKIQTVLEILPFFDNLEKLSEHLKDEGLELTIKDFKMMLKNMGVKEIEAEGKEFDPNIMEAVEVKKGEKNKVIKVYQKGYLLNENLLRPAKVAVGQD